MKKNVKFLLNNMKNGRKNEKSWNSHWTTWKIDEILKKMQNSHSIIWRIDEKWQKCKFPLDNMENGQAICGQWYPLPYFACLSIFQIIQWEFHIFFIIHQFWWEFHEFSLFCPFSILSNRNLNVYHFSSTFHIIQWEFCMD